MKAQFLKALENLQSRFEWNEKNNPSKTDSIRQNNQILLALNDYFEQMEQREKYMADIYTKLIIQFRKRGYFIQLHGYSDYVLDWIKEANEDFLESEIEYRRLNNRPLVPSSLLSWIDLESSHRIVLRKAEIDLESFNQYHEFKNRSCQKNDYSVSMDQFRKSHPRLNFEVSMPEMKRQINFHSFSYEQYN